MTVGLSHHVACDFGSWYYAFSCLVIAAAICLSQKAATAKQNGLLQRVSLLEQHAQTPWAGQKKLDLTFKRQVARKEMWETGDLARFQDMLANVQGLSEALLMFVHCVHSGHTGKLSQGTCCSARSSYAEKNVQYPWHRQAEKSVTAQTLPS